MLTLSDFAGFESRIRHLTINKSLLKEDFCPKGGSIYRVNGIENMNIFRQDLQTVLFTLKSFERSLPLPSAILRTTKAEFVTLACSFFASHDQKNRCFLSILTEPWSHQSQSIKNTDVRKKLSCKSSCR